MAYKSSPRGSRRVTLIAVHTAEGARTATSLGSYFSQDAIQASSHVGIDAGNTLQYVGYDRAAWTLRSGNPISDNAELCAFADFTRGEWLSTGTVRGCVNPRAILDRTAAWIRSRCLARGAPIRKITPADVAAGRSGVIAHWDWTLGMHDGTHTDPGPNFPWDYVINRAAQGAEKEWDDMATEKDFEDGVFNGVRRALASGELRFPDGNFADLVSQLRNSTIDLQTKGDASNKKLDAVSEKLDATNKKLDAVVEGLGAVAAAVRATIK
jgi:hypothetical protein